MKRHLKQYLWAGLVVLLVAAALSVPQGWFALRDAASLNRTHGEALSPLMVAQLDSSYEHDIHERMTAYMDAMAKRDVICSSKEMDPDTELLWENIRQSQDSILMQGLLGNNYVHEYGWDSTIESCTQYALMRQSDGQILLVANDIRLDKGDGCHMEILLDGVDGTVYYLESEEDVSRPPMAVWMDDGSAWDWWLVLNITYQSEDVRLLNENASEYVQGAVYDADIVERNENALAADWEYFFSKLSPSERENREDTAWVRVFNDAYPGLWVSSAKDKDVYCCQLAFGEISVSWAMDLETRDKESYRIRMGLPGVVKYIPEMAGRISLAEYTDIYSQEE